MTLSSPEELDTLLEDALLLRDDDAVAALFASDVLVAAAGSVHVGADATALLAGYVGATGSVRVNHGVALAVGDTAVTVSCRGPDHRWRLLAVVLLREPRGPAR